MIGLGEDNVLYQKAYAFAVKVVQVYQQLTVEKREFNLSKQLVRAGTSIGANIAEANGGFSKADFAVKMSISYKECLETKYWLNLLKDTAYLSVESYQDLYESADELGRILYSVVKSSRIDK
ncbi:MAG TPA: four helix bundle protein [Bacillota bacterium]|nr:four helix bundle protein [Bacillota bacterium]